MMKNKLFSNYSKLWCISFLGFSSGLPFLLILSTLHIWMKECGCSNSTIGLLVFVTLPYSFKFILAPLFNTLSPPVIGPKMGAYKGWIVWSQIGIMISLILISYINPYNQIETISLLAFSVAFCSAIQDIYIEAYRIDLIDVKNMSLASSLSSTGYRIGMWVSGAGALYLASLYSWRYAYTVMAGLMLVGLITIIFSPRLDRKNINTNNKIFHAKNFNQQSIFSYIKGYYYSFNKSLNWSQVILVIIAFKSIDTFLNVMSGPFMMDIGFSKIDIATVGKTFGIGAMIIGGLMSGFLLRYYKLFTMFIVCTLLQMVAALLCIIQVKFGADLNFLYLSMGFEHFASGAAATVFITYLSLLSRNHNTAVLYALLTSAASLSRIIFSHLAGLTVDYSSWQNFFITIMMLCLVFIMLLCFLKKYRNHFKISQLK